MNLLIVGPAWVGDMVMAQILFKLLKKHTPEAVIDVLAPPWTKPLLERMPEIHRAIESPFTHKQIRLWQRYQLGKQLRAYQYGRAIVLPNSLKSALVPFWAKIPIRTGWVGEQRYGLLNDIRKLSQEALPLMAQRFMALGLEKNAPLPSHPDMPNLQVSTDRVRLTLHHLRLDTNPAPILALCPGAEFGPSKRWPAEHYATVANHQIAAGWQVWLFGSAKDKDVAHQINTLTHDRCVNLAGSTQLTEAIDLLSLATLVVTNDSGLMHIAAALNRPMVVIYGSTSPKFTPPLSERVKILSHPIACSPCFQRECPLKHMKCMQDLPPSLAIAAMDALNVDYNFL